MKPDIILGTETWLNQNISTAEVFPANYKVYRRDRSGKDGGGVMIAVHENLDSYAAPELEVQDCEMTWVCVKLQGRRSLYVSAYYRPDKSDEKSLAGLRASLDKASGIQNSMLLIGGDFNAPGIDWRTTSLKPKCPYPNLHNELLSIFNDNGLEQMITEPTRKENTLDLFVTNHPQLIPKTEIIPGLSDHCIPYCEFNIKAKHKKKNERLVPIYSKADWNELRKAATELSNEILERSSDSSTDKLWSHFKSSLTSAIKSLVPHKHIKSKYHLPWISSTIKKLINMKKKIYRKMKKTGSFDLRDTFTNLKRTIQRQIRRSYWTYLNNLFTEDQEPNTK